MTTNMNIEITLATLRQHQLRAEHYKMRILSGIYKSQQVHLGNGKQLSEQELLDNEVLTMERHIDSAEKLLEVVKQLNNKIQNTRDAMHWSVFSD
jgi:hypothetical protein